MVRRNMFIDEPTWNALNKIANHERRPVAEIIREASVQYVENFKESLRAKKAKTAEAAK